MTYEPRGRTDEASYDYTDDPGELAAAFDRDYLRRALSRAEERGRRWCVLKFDFEENVPVEAVRAALAIPRGRFS